MRGRWIIGITSLILVLSLNGCISKDEAQGEQKEVSYTVLGEDDIPEELMEVIQDEKKNAMQFYYTTEGFTYIVIGYGAQQSSGYSIQVDEVYETKEDLVVASTLLGPKKKEKVKKKETMPYLVLKTEETDKDLIFE